ncbi:ABC transporter substrate-binding protein [Chitinimonas koreensis]|uniref:ABC transporter substrate-binding protein n=1 Tax=Chitinimonas koreensis TaxID=356302 RepID=UPI00041ABFC6|nr:ABC transporter substrate-binding protein [Chitinimonas koreensis]QNM98386.1 ABC transporter substrate-binding protein [Chitinimonas koreensis]
MARFAALLLAFVLALSPARAEPAAGGDLLLGLSAALTGPQLENGFHYLRGLRAALAEVNAAGGVGGRPLALVALDDGGEPARTLANTRRLLDEEQVLALVGYSGSASALAAVPLADAAGAALVDPLSGAIVLRRAGRLVFPLRADYGQEIDRLLEQIAAMGLRRLAVVYQPDVLGPAELAALDAALARVGLQESARRALPASNAGYPALAAALAAGQPEALLLATTGAASAGFVRAWRQTGSAAQLVGLSVLSAAQLRSDLGPAAAGIGIAHVVPSPWHSSQPVAGRYRLALKRYQQTDELHHAGLEGYLAGLLLAEGLRRASPQPSRKSLAAALDKLGRLDLGGFRLEYQPGQRKGSGFVDLSVIGSNGDFVQ